MATEILTPNAITMANFKGRVEPDWCPGCGDYGVLAAVQKALVELQIPQHEVATISGIGCSSNFPGFIETYGMHTLHGRSIPVATGHIRKYDGEPFFPQHIVQAVKDQLAGKTTLSIPAHEVMV